jgi:putative restriction endonuclease
VVEAYQQRCAVCGLKIKSPDSVKWEVEAAHIVPNRSFGRDDICNGLALCHLHHWAFDVGWFTLRNDYKVLVSPKIQDLPADFGKVGNYEFFRVLANQRTKIYLPMRSEIYPHQNALRWHREIVFHQKSQ